MFMFLVWVQASDSVLNLVVPIYVSFFFFFVYYALLLIFIKGCIILSSILNGE